MFHGKRPWHALYWALVEEFIAMEVVVNVNHEKYVFLYVTIFPLQTPRTYPNGRNLYSCEIFEKRWHKKHSYVYRFVLERKK